VTPTISAGANQQLNTNGKNPYLAAAITIAAKTPQATPEEEDFVIEKSRRNQPQRTEGADDVIGIVLGIVDVGMVLQVYPREHREAEAEQQGRPMAHESVPEAIGMGGVVAGVVDHRALEVQRQKTGEQQEGQGPLPHEPTPDGEPGQGEAPQEETHGWVPGRRRIEVLARHRAHIGASDLSAMGAGPG
jgi:hypothetical protein